MIPRVGLNEGEPFPGAHRFQASPLPPASELLQSDPPLLLGGEGERACEDFLIPLIPRHPGRIERRHEAKLPGELMGQLRALGTPCDEVPDHPPGLLG